MFTDSEKKRELRSQMETGEETKEGVWAPPEVKEAAGHSGVILLLFLKLPVPLQAALATLMQVRGYIDA